jgi:hypothetical protein
MNEHRWGRVIDSGWSDWDIEMTCHLWNVIRVCTAQEDHGSGRRVIGVRYRLCPSGYTKAMLGVAALAAVAAAVLRSWPAAAVAVILLAACLGFRWGGTRRASQAVAVFDAQASDLGLVRCKPSPEPDATASASMDAEERRLPILGRMYRWRWGA